MSVGYEGGSVGVLRGFAASWCFGGGGGEERGESWGLALVYRKTQIDSEGLRRNRSIMMDTECKEKSGTYGRKLQAVAGLTETKPKISEISFC